MDEELDWDDYFDQLETEEVDEEADEEVDEEADDDWEPAFDS